MNTGIDFTKDDIKKILERIKKLEWQGFTFEDADASFELMLRDVLEVKPIYFELKGFTVLTDTREMGVLNTEASVKIKIGDEIFHTVSEGEGPGHALDKALRLALKPFYPAIEKFKLIDFKVRILDGTDGTGAKTKVHVETSDGFKKWDTAGVSRNIIEATYFAIVDSLDYGLLLHKEIPQNKHILSF